MQESPTAARSSAHHAAALLGERPQQPLLYLSVYFEQNREAYYDHLRRVRTEGAWEDWLAFFLEGVIAVASSARETARRITQLVESDREAMHGLGRGAASALRVHELAGRHGGPAEPRRVTDAHGRAAHARRGSEP